MNSSSLTKRGLVLRVLFSFAALSLSSYLHPRFHWLFVALMVITLGLAALYWPLVSRRRGASFTHPPNKALQPTAQERGG